MRSPSKEGAHRGESGSAETRARRTTDTAMFFRTWLSDPLRVASIVPSSPTLARLVTSQVPAGRPVLELGPGTGVFTQALLRRGVHASDLTLVELGGEFAELLARRFPEATILRLDASRLSRHADPLPRYGAAVSGLPLLSMSRKTVLRILVGTFRLLEDDASLFQFTYGFRPPVAALLLDRLGLRAERVGTAWSNLPPATVYRISRREIRHC